MLIACLLLLALAGVQNLAAAWLRMTAESRWASIIHAAAGWSSSVTRTSVCLQSMCAGVLGSDEDQLHKR